MANNDRWARGRPAAALRQFLVLGLLACAPACAGAGPASPSLHQRLLVLDSYLDLHYSAPDIQKIWGLDLLRVLAAAESHADNTRGAGR